jgi:uncharacterized RDD family membrane protein YckC
MTDGRPGPAPRPTRAGWFEDPDDPEQLRYFDGILWTKNTTPRRTIWGASAPAAGPTSSSSSAPGVQGAPPATAGPYGYPRQPGSGVGPGQPGSGPHELQPPPQGGAYGSTAYREPLAQGPVTEDGVPLASIGSRFTAWLLDSLITWAFGLLLGMPLLWRGLGNYPQVVADAMRTGVVGDAAALAERIQFDFAWIGAFAVLQLVIGVAYHTIFLSRRGATPGKAVVGISVRLRERPGLLTTTDAMRRSVLRPVLWLFTYTPVLSLFAMPVSVFDAVSALWDPQRQTLHDKIGRTVVVRGRQERPRRGRHSEPGRR